MAGPNAMGKFPHIPISIHAMKMEIAVAQNTAFVSIPAFARIAGFKITTLAQDKNVVIPAMHSVFTSLPLSLI